jgi:hypothetical protein
MQELAMHKRFDEMTSKKWLLVLGALVPTVYVWALP